jgi:hypothetical protein
MSIVVTVVSIVALLASLAVLWAGIRRFEFGSFTRTVLSMLELLGIAVSVISLGWVGLGLFVGANVIAILVWSVVLASRQQTKLTYASTLCGESRDAMYALARRLRSRHELRNYGPIAIADLIVRLADRNRTTNEIESMAVPIAMLKTIHDVPLDWLVDRFDQIMRLSGETDPINVADIVHNTTRHSPMSFREALDALVAVYGGDITTVATAA